MDSHVHTKYSGHSILKPEDVARAIRKKKLDAVAITDHDTIAGALEVSKLVKTVVGEEITCEEGDLIGLFISEEVRGGPALEVMDRIREQGGIVVVPHPFDSMRSEAIMDERICMMADAIEVFNARVLRQKDNARALAFSRKHNILGCVGSDAHTSIEIGRCWMDVQSIDDAQSYLKSLHTADVHTSQSPAVVHAQTKLLKMMEGLR